MTTWTFERKSTGDEINVTAGSRWNDGIAALSRHMTPVFEAARADGKRINTLKTDATKDGFELIAVDGQPRSTKFGFIVTWYQPTVITALEYDGTQADWHSGKFHA